MTTIVYTGNSSINPPFPVTNSVRLRAAATASFSRTAGTPTSAFIWTVSAWLKIGSNPGGSTFCLLGGGNTSPNFLYNYIDLATGTFQLYAPNSGATLNLISTRVFRDPSAWYHFVIAVDTTQATASNRVKLYVNGEQITAFNTTSYPALNATFFWNQNGITQRLGSISGAAGFFDGYYTEIVGVDGQQLTPSAFGSFNGTTGVWQPIKYSGTYGNNGFYLNFRDNSGATATTIGKDSSGNNNNWTPINISVTAGPTYDSMIDVPGMPTASASNYPTLNNIAAQNAGGTYSRGNLNFISGVASQWRGAVATQFLTSGKFYFEATIVVLDSYNYLMIGACGIQTNSSLFGNYTGSVANGWSVQSGVTSGGTRYNNGTGVNISNASFTQFVLNDVLKCAVDVTNGRIWFGKNNVWLEGDPAAGTGASYTNLTGPIAPSVSCFSSTAQLATNFGQRPFTYTPPTGFNPVNSYNLGVPTIPNGAAQFAATLYTGTGAARSVANTVQGVSFQPDFVWMKQLTGTQSHVLQDSVRGATRYLSTNTAGAEVTDAQTLTAFNSNGFSLGTSTGINGNTVPYVGWNWKASNAAAVSNTSGSITSSVSANPAAGFSIVSYTGTGANATVGHGLGVAPRMMIFKNRDNAASNWSMYHASLGATNVILLNSINASLANGWLQNTTPTSTVFSLGAIADGYTQNISTQKQIAYCFSQIAGYSSFGSYSGNGVADGPFIYTGFRPRWVLIKNSNSGGANWVIFDASRSPNNEVTLYLIPSTADAQGSAATLVIDILSNGFKARGAQPTVNQSGNTMIYAAFAENPFQYALAR